MMNGANLPLEDSKARDDDSSTAAGKIFLILNRRQGLRPLTGLLKKNPKLRRNLGFFILEFLFFKYAPQFSL
jgi:hypothetical protein